MTTETTKKVKNKLRTYRTFKLDHKQELYLTQIKDTLILSDLLLQK